ncbi:MAG: translation initiation factor IF-2 [Pseudomonadota bacterium]|nr:translation initiation factor IF-2 [Pseudomonadota bacterium]
MADVTVERFAKSVGISVVRLQDQLKEAGISSKGPQDSLTDSEKTQLLTYLRKIHGKNESASEPDKITLKRKTVSEIKVPTERRTVRVRGTKPSSASKTVSIEVRKKRTYVKRKTASTEESSIQSVEQDNSRTESPEVLKKNLNENNSLEGIKQTKPEDGIQPLEKGINAEIVAKESVKGLENAQLEDESVESQNQPAIESSSDETKHDQAQQKPSNLNEQESQPKKGQAKAEESLPSDNVTKAPLKDTSNIRKPSKNKDKKSYQKEDREELHVAIEKSGKRKKKSSPGKIVSPSVAKHAFEKPTAPVVKEVEIPDNINVGELASRMSVKAGEVIKVLMNLGTMATINQILDQDTATLVVEELGHKPKLVNVDTLNNPIELDSSDLGEPVPRAPIVTIMGHVDHGKTSLLDFIRQSKVAAGEAGGITQHIGAYRVPTPNGDVTFLDTPGHEAFASMRARGASVTDIVILVVAADDGVMPQTEEAIKHAKSGDVPIVVAVNKIDKEEAQPDKVKQELSSREVVPEEWGGDTQFVNVSAKTGDGVDKLLEAVILQSEVLELKSPEKGSARGVIIESRLEKGRGPVATILVQAGTLNKGDILVAGGEFGRVRAMSDATKIMLDHAGPSDAVEIVGLSGTPKAGEEAVAVEDERRAREIATYRFEKERETRLSRRQSFQMENMFANMEKDKQNVFRVLLKADVQGSCEAITDALMGIENTEVRVDVVSDGVGAITESDVNLAFASEAIVLAFNVRAESSAKKLLEEEGIELRYYSVIYELIDDVKAAVSGLLAPEVREKILGTAEVKDVFRSSKFGSIAGCIVAEGIIKKSCPIRVLRQSVVIYEGELESLRRFQEDVQSVQSGTECGIGVKNYNDVQAGDQIEVYERVEIARKVQ